MTNASITEPDTLTIRRPDDWHLHLRDGAAMASVVGHSAHRFARAVIMPNLKPPITTVAQAREYRQRVLAALSPADDFRPMMTLYLTESMSPAEIAAAAADDDIVAVKLYPAGATTHSEQGIAQIERIFPLLEALERVDMPLLIHGEATAPEVDIFDRERVFVEQILERLVRDFPGLRIVLEHVSTREAVDFVREAPENVAATITPHHLLYNRNAILTGGIRPHLYCLPILKTEPDRLALIEAATSGNPRFFLGTDSAPHPIGDKQSACGCAGIFSAHAALELYAEVFEDAGALDRLEPFASEFGADFYRLPRNDARVRLERTEWRVPEDYAFGPSRVVPVRAGEPVRWRVVREA